MIIVIAAGGTGGHIYPGISVARKLLEKNVNNQIYFIGSDLGIEKEILTRENFQLLTISSRKLVRKFTLSNILSIINFFLSLFQSIKILKSLSPNLLFATGGFASFPVVVAARVLRIPIILHEQNVIPGLSVKILSRFANKICLSWSESKQYLKLKNTTITGNPVRIEILNTTPERQSIKTIVVLGGSQGAAAINKAAADMISLIKPKDNIKIIHISGNRDFNIVKSKFKSLPNFYHLIPYSHDIWNILKFADLAVSRAGAMAISEFAAMGIPSVLIPFPYSSESHQDYNANLFKMHGASIAIRNDELSPGNLLSIIMGLLHNKDKLKTMSACAKFLATPIAADMIVEEIYNEAV